MPAHNPTERKDHILNVENDLLHRNRVSQISKPNKCKAAQCQTMHDKQCKLWCQSFHLQTRVGMYTVITAKYKSSTPNLC